MCVYSFVCSFAHSLRLNSLYGFFSAIFIVVVVFFFFLGCLRDAFIFIYLTLSSYSFAWTMKQYFFLFSLQILLCTFSQATNNGCDRMVLFLFSKSARVWMNDGYFVGILLILSIARRSVNILQIRFWSHFDWVVYLG